MLNIFPGLLIPFLAPTLLRVAAAAVLLYLAYQQYKRRKEIAALRPSTGEVFTWGAVAFNTALGAILLFGLYTQGAALLAALGQFYGLWLNKKYPSVVILPNSTVILLIVILLSLVLSGAGAFAQDLPL